MWTLLPGPNAVEWAEGINLPAAAIVTPIEFAVRRHPWRNPDIMFFGLWLVGLICWLMVGRFIDDLFQWRTSHTLPRKHRGDLTFALIAAPSAVLLALAFNFEEASTPIFAVWGAFWVFITVSALLFRVLQFFRQSRRTATS
jgi:hypothetical protein